MSEICATKVLMAKMGEDYRHHPLYVIFGNDMSIRYSGRKFRDFCERVCGIQYAYKIGFCVCVIFESFVTNILYICLGLFAYSCA